MQSPPFLRRANAPTCPQTNDRHYGNPQSLNLYGYVGDNPLSKADRDGHCPWCDFALGAANAFGSDFAGGAGRVDQTSAEGRSGATLGDAAATVGGAVETTLGFGGEVGGLALDATGVGAALGVPVAAVSTAVVVQGASATGQGASHLMKDTSANDLGHSAESKTSSSGKTTTTVTDPGGSTKFKTDPGKTGGQAKTTIRKDANGNVKYVKQEAWHHGTDNHKTPDHIHFKRPIDKTVK